MAHKHRAAVLGPHLRHRLQDARRQHQVIGQQHNHGVLVSRQHGLHAADGVSQSERFGLHHGFDLDQRGRAPHLGQHGLLATRLERALEHQVLDEVRDDAVLALGGDDHQAFGTGRGRLLGDQLDAGRVDDGQQLLGHRLGRRQKTRAQAGRGHDRREWDRDFSWA